MQGQLVLIPITQLGKDKFKEHIKDTTLSDKIKLMRQGVKQYLEGNNLILEFKNLSINILNKYFEEEYISAMHANKSKLTNDIAKLGIIENKDYKVEIR